MTTVKELIAKLQKCDPNLPISIEPLIACTDSEINSEIAYNAIHNKLDDITLYITEAQSNRDPGDSFNEDYIEYSFAPYGWIDPIDTKKLLIISSPILKYGAKVDDLG